MMAVAMIGTPMSHATIFGLQGWRVAFVMIGSFPIFTSMLIKVGDTSTWRYDNHEDLPNLTMVIYFPYIATLN